MDADQETSLNDLPVVAGTGTQPEPTIALPAVAEYCCPGEDHAIPRSVHLSRLAAYYPACRSCPHRHDTGQLPPGTVERIQQVEHRSISPSIFQPDGIRGVYLNELTTMLAGQVAAAFASLLWEEIPVMGRATGQRRRPVQKRSGPSVVVGYDERPSSPAIVASVVDSLRMMGCAVIDVGLVSRPCLCHAVEHLQAAGGVFVTGSGCEASWTGLDLLGEGALPLSLGTGLERIEQRMSDGVSRPVRHDGSQRSFQALVPYEAGLWKHFHDLKPLHVVAAIRPRPVRRTVRKVFGKLPCRLSEVETAAAMNAPIRESVLLRRVQKKVQERSAHLGALVGDDGTSTTFVDEQGKVVPQASLTLLLDEEMRNQNPRSRIVLDETVVNESESDRIESSLSAEMCSPTRGEMARRIASVKATHGSGHGGCYWFRESYPAADSVLILAHVLQSLSRSDASFSKRLQRFHPPADAT